MNLYFPVAIKQAKVYSVSTLPTVMSLAILLIFSLSITSTWLYAQENETTNSRFSSVEERRLYNQMQKERSNLEQDKKELDIRENELKTLEESVDKKIAEIDTKIEELKKLQKKIESLLAEKSIEEQRRTKELSTIFEKMIPEKAALAIIGMEPSLATELLANMKPKSAAKILNKVDKKHASELSTNFTTIQIE